MTARISVKAATLPAALTRIFNAKYLESSLSGYFRFGMLASYRNAEGIGRFSDKEEGLRSRGFRNRSGENITIPEFGLYNVLLSDNGGPDLQIDTSVNVPVACLSIGGCSLQRSHGFMQGNPDLVEAAFVEYDSRTLVDALSYELACDEWFSDIGGKSGMVGLPVQYEQRLTEEDLHTPKSFDISMNDVTRAIWNKPSDFSAEEEYRLALFATNKTNTGITIPKSTLIENAIVGSGIVIPRPK